MTEYNVREGWEEIAGDDGNVEVGDTKISLDSYGRDGDGYVAWVEVVRPEMQALIKCRCMEITDGDVVFIDKENDEVVRVVKP